MHLLGIAHDGQKTLTHSWSYIFQLFDRTARWYVGRQRYVILLWVVLYVRMSHGILHWCLSFLHIQIVWAHDLVRPGHCCWTMLTLFGLFGPILSISVNAFRLCSNFWAHVMVGPRVCICTMFTLFGRMCWPTQGDAFDPCPNRLAHVMVWPHGCYL